MRLGMLRALLVVSVVALLLAPARRIDAQGAERPTQIVATSTATKNLVNSSYGSCVAIQAAPGTGNMLAADLTISKGIRELVLSAAFQNATIVYARINGVNLALLSGAAFGADQLAGPIAIPVEEGDTVNFRLSVGNDGAATRKFKIEAVAGW